MASEGAVRVVFTEKHTVGNVRRTMALNSLGREDAIVRPQPGEKY